LNKSASKDDEPTKKIKKDEPAGDAEVQKALSEPKKTKSKAAKQPLKPAKMSGEDDLKPLAK
jgi:hypothetical protein